MQKSLFENEMLNIPPNPLFLIARVSGSLLTKLKFKIWEHK